MILFQKNIYGTFFYISPNCSVKSKKNPQQAVEILKISSGIVMK